MEKTINLDEAEAKRVLNFIDGYTHGLSDGPVTTRLRRFLKDAESIATRCADVKARLRVLDVELSKTVDEITELEEELEGLE